MSFKDPNFTIFIIDDQPVFIAGLKVIIEKEGDLKVVGGASSWETIPPDLPSKPPDLFIVEIFLRNSDGFRLLTLLRKHYPKSAILVYSIQDEAVCGERALQSGAKGYLMKSANLTSIVEAVRRLAQGHLYLSDRLQAMLLSHRGSHTGRDLRSLTNRELQVMQFIGQGWTTQEIADAMNLQVKTVEAHRQRIRKKLNLKHTPDLIRYAVHWIATSGTMVRASSF